MKAISPTLARQLPPLLALLILLGGVTALLAVQRSFHVVLQKQPTPLQKPLYTLPTRLPPFLVRPGWVDQKLPPEEVQALGTRDYLLRKYWYSRAAPDAPAAILAVNINYYPTSFATPHVPNVCWAGLGRKRIYDSLITVPRVPHANGSISAIPMRFLSFAVATGGSAILPLLHNSSHGGRFINTAYTFQVDGRYVADPQQVSALFWRKRSRFGYDAKIEVDILGPSRRAVARRRITAFLRAALPAIEKCLPDWRKLNHGQTGQ